MDSQLLFNWNNVFWGTTVMLAKITNQGAYHQLVRPPPSPLCIGQKEDCGEYIKL